MAVELILQKITCHLFPRLCLCLRAFLCRDGLPFFSMTVEPDDVALPVYIHGNSFHVIPQMLFNYLGPDTDRQSEGKATLWQQLVEFCDCVYDDWHMARHNLNQLPQFGI